MRERVGDDGEPRAGGGPTHILVPMEVWCTFLVNMGQPIMDGSRSGAMEGAGREHEKHH